jgi:hypothetical protein
MRDLRSRRRSEAGSAYIIALLVLVVLSLLGLGLALISQTEVQIGANELTSHRALYNAENGIHLALARKLTVNSTAAESSVEETYRMLFVIPEPRQKPDGSYVDPNALPSGASKFGEALEVSPFYRIVEECCDGCACNEGGQKLVNVTFAVVARSDRIVWDGDARFNIKPFVPGAGGTSEANPEWDKISEAPRSATKQVFAMKGVGPWWPSVIEGGRAEDKQDVFTQNVLGGHTAPPSSSPP